MLILIAAAVHAGFAPPGRTQLAPAGAAAEAAAGATRPAATGQQAAVRRKTQVLADRWKDRFEAERLSAVVAPPFVIAGDGTPARLAAYRDGTVLAAERSLRAQFFATPLDEPVLILLFESAEPYRRLAKAWFDEDDVPHYGFYQHADHAMLMNVGTGTGTLVHELTHALIAPDFPGVPDWFNEGLASLYEQCRFGPPADAARGAAGREASIRGEPNWRLPALRAAIQAGTLRPVREMIADADFRNAGRVGLNYAHARYLMFYLQEKKLLQRYYADFRAAREADPSGVDTLKKVIAPQSIEAFERDWRAWVMTLRFEG